MRTLDDIAEKIQSLLDDEESMRQITELAAMLSGGELSGGDPADDTSGSAPEGSSADSGGLGFDPMAVMRLLGAASAGDSNIELLKALRPHLSEERQKKLDKAQKLLRLYNVFSAMRESGMLNDLEGIL